MYFLERLGEYIGGIFLVVLAILLAIIALALLVKIVLIGFAVLKRIVRSWKNTDLTNL